MKIMPINFTADIPVSSIHSWMTQPIAINGHLYSQNLKGADANALASAPMASPFDNSAADNNNNAKLIFNQTCNTINKTIKQYTKQTTQLLLNYTVISQQH